MHGDGARREADVQRSLTGLGLRERTRAQAEVDVEGMLAAAQRRAGARRRTVRAASGAAVLAAVLAVGVPLAMSRPWAAPERPRPAAAPSASPAPEWMAYQAEASPLLPDSQVAVVVAGVAPVGPPVSERRLSTVSGGLCLDEPVLTADPLERGIRQTWIAAPGGDLPTDTVEERVRIFRGDGARQYFRATLVGSSACLSPPDDTSSWAFDEVRKYRAEEVIAAWSVLSPDYDAFRTAVVMREGAVVVELHITVRGDLNHALDVTRTLAQQALYQALATEQGW
ncbi:hypothetical protein [Kineococcus xinjiangensis]|uniref:hypothetical protein n=1 Tax=Kineococcus xinjiangensis TaxID=512762 RepID=UPI00130505B8|nr:hypothetical protein [Kineococcus xinjiangensis]